ncbi:hypothetical protein [Sphingomonas sp. VNH70]|uniref:hypothetical protein n=1 Tax=Sphingomonas silueang TaxID=3156617 RepID=UPI0032B40A16
MPDTHWGEHRAAARQRARVRWIAGIAAVLIASPFALDFAARRYVATGGTTTDGRFPLWLPLAYWAIVIAVALTGVYRLHRSSDEVERRRLIDGFAASGLLLGLFVPPAIFVGTINSVMLVWIVALFTGLAVFARPRLS